MNAPQKTKRKKESASTKAAKPLSRNGKESARHLTKLGQQPTEHASKALETFANPAPHRDFLIHMQIPEFTCLCPKTGQPDFATLYLDTIPEKLCVELKSLKLYIWSFRDEGKFHEAVTNEILDDIVKAIKPRFARLTAKFWVRGGVFTTVIAEHRAKGWKGAPVLDLQAFADDKSVSGRG